MYGWDSHDDVLENFDFEKLARSNEVASDLDVRFGRRGGRRSDAYVDFVIFAVGWRPTSASELSRDSARFVEG